MLSYTIRLKGLINTVLHYPRKQKYTVLTSHQVHHFTGEQLVDQLPLCAEGKETEVESILQAEDHGVYVGVCKHTLLLFNRSFQSLHQIGCEEKISTSIFNSWSGQLITAGLGYFKVKLYLYIYVCVCVCVCFFYFLSSLSRLSFSFLCKDRNISLFRDALTHIHPLPSP